MVYILSKDRYTTPYYYDPEAVCSLAAYIVLSASNPDYPAWTDDGDTSYCDPGKTPYMSSDCKCSDPENFNFVNEGTVQKNANGIYSLSLFSLVPRTSKRYLPILHI